jgi:hypothetical protein
MLLLVFLSVLATFSNGVFAGGKTDTSVLETRITTVVSTRTSIWDRWRYVMGDIVRARELGDTCMQSEACRFTFKSIAKSFNKIVEKKPFDRGDQNQCMDFKNEWCNLEPP